MNSDNQHLPNLRECAATLFASTAVQQATILHVLHQYAAVFDHMHTRHGMETFEHDEDDLYDRMDEAYERLSDAEKKVMQRISSHLSNLQVTLANMEQHC